jgi:glycosyltransferase involved in cell wall biosynthesis
MPLEFGLFDWLDENPTSARTADTYEQRLRVLRYADEAGFWGYHLAEHHGTPLGTAPSPGLFLSAAAQHTRRIRLGPLVYLLPLYDPVRLTQEICMLDHLTRGRLELGVGRGASPYELALFNVTPDETRAMYAEALEIILQGLRTGRMHHEGKYWTVKDVATRGGVRQQRPCPRRPGVQGRRRGPGPRHPDQFPPLCPQQVRSVRVRCRVLPAHGLPPVGLAVRRINGSAARSVTPGERRSLCPRDTDRRASETSTMTPTVHDVAILSDFRYPGGTSASIAAEIRAQARAGVSTVLVQARSPHLKRDRPFNPLIVEALRDGLADLSAEGEQVHARLLVLRQPRIFTRDLPAAPRIRADRCVMVLNQAPGDAADPARYYDFAEVRARLEGYFGAGVEWAPISPQVRAEVLRAAPGAALAEHDWHEIIDTADWWTERSGPVGGVPVIGRHGRPDPVKWPRTAEELLQAYPDNPSLRVRVLGGGELAVEKLGRQPENWEVLEFGTVTPAEFLRGLDFFVYFHDPDLVEAFGRTIMEAMAAGVPVVIGEHFRPVFGDAALYTTPAGVAPLVHQLYDDQRRCREVARRAREFVEERFGYPSHVARLAERGVRPARRSLTGGDPASDAAGGGASGSAGGLAGGPGTMVAEPPGGVLLVSDNGAGLGHLSRLMAIARRLPPETPAVIATQSHGASVAHREGFLTEYIPSRRVLGLPRQRWTELLRSRLEHLVDLHRPAVVAVDSVPHDGIVDAVRSRRDVTWVWVRRPMWRRDTGHEWIERGAVFDGILEPGEFAGAADEGPTVADRARAHEVAPITYLDRHELVDRDAAREALGLDPERPAALLQLGAGNINDISTPAARIAARLRDAGFQVVLAESAIATEPMPPVPGAVVVKAYPISRYLRGLDLVISASGYNSFHELLAFGVPTVFVPNRETSLDDQVSRARFAAAAGAALIVEDPEGEDLDRVLDRAVRPEVREELSRRCAEIRIGNGAAAAARWLVGLADPALAEPTPIGAC